MALGRGACRWPDAVPVQAGSRTAGPAAGRVRSEPQAGRECVLRGGRPSVELPAQPGVGVPYLQLSFLNSGSQAQGGRSEELRVPRGQAVGVLGVGGVVTHFCPGPRSWQAGGRGPAQPSPLVCFFFFCNLGGGDRRVRSPGSYVPSRGPGLCVSVTTLPPSWMSSLPCSVRSPVAKANSAMVICFLRGGVGKVGMGRGAGRRVWPLPRTAWAGAYRFDVASGLSEPS